MIRAMAAERRGHTAEDEIPVGRTGTGLWVPSSRGGRHNREDDHKDQTHSDLAPAWALVLAAVLGYWRSPAAERAAWQKDGVWLAVILTVGLLLPVVFGLLRGRADRERGLPLGSLDSQLRRFVLGLLLIGYAPLAATVYFALAETIARVLGLSPWELRSPGQRCREWTWVAGAVFGMYAMVLVAQVSLGEGFSPKLAAAAGTAMLVQGFTWHGRGRSRESDTDQKL